LTPKLAHSHIIYCLWNFLADHVSSIAGLDAPPYNPSPVVSMNGYSMETNHSTMDNLVMSSHSASSHSSPSLISQHSSPSSHPESPAQTPYDDQIDRVGGDSASDIDAEGSEDVDYSQLPTVPDVRHIHVDPPTPSSTSSHSQNGKRRLEEDDESYIRDNPDLFGLRRSVSLLLTCLLALANLVSLRIVHTTLVDLYVMSPP
jgi:chromodomain-helicase-DNA-binding protein 1